MVGARRTQIPPRPGKRTTKKKGRVSGPFILYLQSVPYSPASARSAAALSIASQLNSGSSRPKWP
jgi:hypothetical protein